MFLKCGIEHRKLTADDMSRVDVDWRAFHLSYSRKWHGLARKPIR